MKLHAAIILAALHAAAVAEPNVPEADGTSPRRTGLHRRLCYYGFNEPVGCTNSECWKLCGESWRDGQWCWTSEAEGQDRRKFCRRDGDCRKTDPCNAEGCGC
ncbi:hypothetical protein CDD83_593 [Cordyceps sp. RAO-2017]|nr:hypothetical protein CDD83_593 [Cordyceps sp. RAO-2017]